MSAKSASTRSAPRRVRMSVDDRRAQLLGIGERVFGEQPYDEVSTEAIAAEAGISHGLLFHYFPTKHAFYVGVLRVAADDLLRKAIAQTEGSPAERLFAGLDAYFRFVEEHARTYATLLRAGVGSDSVVKELVDETREKFVGAIRETLAPHAKGAAEKRRLRAALRGWIGFVEAIALDWIDNRDLPREDLVSLALGAMGVVPGVERVVGAG